MALFLSPNAVKLWREKSSTLSISHCANQTLAIEVRTFLYRYSQYILVNHSFLVILCDMHLNVRFETQWGHCVVSLSKTCFPLFSFGLYQDDRKRPSMTEGIMRNISVK